LKEEMKQYKREVETLEKELRLKNEEKEEINKRITNELNEI